MHSSRARIASWKAALAALAIAHGVSAFAGETPTATPIATPSPTDAKETATPSPTELKVTPTPSPSDAEKTPTASPTATDLSPSPSPTEPKSTPTASPTDAKATPTVSPTPSDPPSPTESPYASCTPVDLFENGIAIAGFDPITVESGSEFELSPEIGGERCVQGEPPMCVMLFPGYMKVLWGSPYLTSLNYTEGQITSPGATLRMKATLPKDIYEADVRVEYLHSRCGWNYPFVEFLAAIDVTIVAPTPTPSPTEIPTPSLTATVSPTVSPTPSDAPSPTASPAPTCTYTYGFSGAVPLNPLSPVTVTSGSTFQLPATFRIASCDPNDTNPCYFESIGAMKAVWGTPYLTSLNYVEGTRMSPSEFPALEMVAALPDGLPEASVRVSYLDCRCGPDEEPSYAGARYDIRIVAPTPTPSPSPTESPTPSLTATVSPSPSITAAATPTASESPTASPTASDAPTASPSLTALPSPSPSEEITATPTAIPTSPPIADGIDAMLGEGSGGTDQNGDGMQDAADIVALLVAAAPSPTATPSASALPSPSPSGSTTAPATATPTATPAGTAAASPTATCILGLCEFRATDDTLVRYYSFFLQGTTLIVDVERDCSADLCDASQPIEMWCEWDSPDLTSEYTPGERFPAPEGAGGRLPEIFVFPVFTGEPHATFELRYYQAPAGQPGDGKPFLVVTTYYYEAGRQ